MELPVQAKLLRALETRTIGPVGSNDEQEVDVCVVAATHRNLRALVEEGRFRQDLYCLHHTGGSRQRTAALLGISTRTLLRKIQEYGLDDPLRQPKAVSEARIRSGKESKEE